jgi:hypothetical protein
MMMLIQAREMNEKSCKHYGVKKEEMFTLEDLKKGGK